MLDNQTPKKFRSNTVISVNDTISCGDDGLGIGKGYVRIVLEHLINGLSHNFHIPFHGTLSQCVIFEILIIVWVDFQRMRRLPCKQSIRLQDIFVYIYP